MQIEHGDHVLKMDTAQFGVVCGIREDGQIVAGDKEGHHFSGLAAELAPATIEQALLWMRRDYIEWVPELTRLLTDKECTCGRRVAAEFAGSKLDTFPCNYCMAWRLIELYYPLAPKAVLSAGANEFLAALKEAFAAVSKQLQEQVKKSGLQQFLPDS
jgi:hypothetical protein